MTDSTRQFILTHRQDDVATLALKADRYPDIDIETAIHQIAGWQKARVKLPSWALLDDIVYPRHLSLEQCSSETTARYKQQLCKRLRKEMGIINGTFADLTGGFGVDSAFIAEAFDSGIYIEQDHLLCQCARHNFDVLHLHHIQVVEGDSMEIIDTLPLTGMLFIDPARRDDHGARTFAIADCTPDILPHLPQLLGKTDIMMVKLSPMLDWHHTMRSLNAVCPHCVREIHIVATGNECKELLMVLSSKHTSQPVTLTCTNDGQSFLTHLTVEDNNMPVPTVDDITEALKAQWIYEPHAAIMKGGCFATIARKYGVKALSANSHLFVSEKPVIDFPGRQLRILHTTTLNKQQLREALKGIDRANITVRNFPMTAAQLRQKLRLADGGETYLMASTIGKNKHLVFICTK